MSGQNAPGDSSGKDLVFSRFGMLFIGVRFVIFVSIFQFILTEGIFTQEITNAGDSIDVWNYLCVFIASLISLPIIAILKHVLFPSPESGSRTEGKAISERKEPSPEISPRTEITRQFSIFLIPKNEMFSQLKHALLMWLVIFVPLDFISYLIPGELEFEAKGLYVPALQEGLYLTVASFSGFFVLSVIMHFFVASSEEIRFRGVFQYLNQEKVGVTSAVVISAIFFGLSHFNYWFSDTTQSIFYPLWWAASGIFVGIILSLYIKTTGRIWPMIIAHWWNNVVSTITIWTFLPTRDATHTISTVALNLYLPLIAVGIILALLWRRTIINAATIAQQEIKTYLRQPHMIILLDLVFGIGIWAIFSFIFL